MSGSINETEVRSKLFSHTSYYISVEKSPIDGTVVAAIVSLNIFQTIRDWYKEALELDINKTSQVIDVQAGIDERPDPDDPVISRVLIMYAQMTPTIINDVLSKQGIPDEQRSHTSFNDEDGFLAIEKEAQRGVVSVHTLLDLIRK